jgi:two-component system, NtrC family, nitrogen regulation sensor histidine kinase NtrY
VSFRARLFLLTAVAVLVPLTVLALGVRRVQALGADIALERERIAARLAALAVDLADDNRFRLAAVRGDAASRSYLLDWAGGAMRLAGLSLLQLQDSGGRILSSGHFRNEYDRVRPELPEFFRAAGTAPALVRVRTANAPLLALAGVERFSVAGRPFDLVGGIAAEDRFLSRLDPDPDLSLALVTPDSAQRPAPDARVVSSLSLPFFDQGRGAADSARLVVTRTSGTLAALQRGLNTWFVVSLAITAILALALAAWLSRLISRPLTELAGKTATIDLDRLDVDFATDRNDEIGSLSRLLGAMTSRLRSGAARLREAERRVAMGDLARQVNHDIKNGLVPIRNVLRHLEEVSRERPDTLSAVFEERRATLDSSVSYLDTLARNYARLSPAAAPEVCDVNAIVAEVVRASPAPAVRTRLATELPPAAADRLMLRRVVENLVGNAVDGVAAAGRGEVVVSTEAVARDGDGPVVRITVADNGPGMTRAELDRAFDDFYTTKPGGTGLGLSIVRRLVLDLGGSLRMETEPGTGTQATVEIPAGRPGGLAR